MWMADDFRLEEIGGSAAKEYSLEKAMEKMKVEWQPMHFEFTPYRDTVSSCVLWSCCSFVADRHLLLA